MKQFFLILTLMLCVFVAEAKNKIDTYPATPIYGFLNADNFSGQYSLSADEGDEEFEDFSPGLGLFALMATIFMIICIGAGAVITAVVLLFVFVFISAGILSASVMVGLHKRSVSSGFKTLIYSFGIILGTITGLIFFIALHKICHWWTLEETLIMGGLCGLVGGYLLSILVFYTLRKLSSIIKNKIDNKPFF